MGKIWVQQLQFVLSEGGISQVISLSHYPCAAQHDISLTCTSLRTWWLVTTNELFPCVQGSHRVPGVCSFDLGTAVICEELSQPLKRSAIHCSGLPFFISSLFGAGCVIESQSLWPVVGLSSHELSSPSRLPWHSLPWAASQPQARACSSLE